MLPTALVRKPVRPGTHAIHEHLKNHQITWYTLCAYGHIQLKEPERVVKIELRYRSFSKKSQVTQDFLWLRYTGNVWWQEKTRLMLFLKDQNEFF